MSKQIRGTEVDPNEIQKTLWIWSYQYNEIMLSRDFALDSNSKKLVRDFLKELSEGSSIPIRLESDKSFYYKLFKIASDTSR
jgi:hypothetical protein